MDSSVAESGKCPPPVLRPSDSPPLLLQAALGIVALAFLYLLSRQNYLLYHGIVEIFSVVVSVTIFSIGWNARRFAPDNTLLILAVAYLPVAILDFLHVLGYMGMGIFAGRGADLPTQLWIAARYLESISLLLVALLLGSGRRLRPGWFLATSLLVGAALIAVIVPWPIFPACYVEGQGLTPFKVASEYIISGLLVLAAFLFWRHRQAIQPRLLFLLIASVALTVLSELSFTLYFDVYGLFNFVGHAFKLFSVILVYFVLVRGSLKSPFESLFRELARELAQRKASEEKLAATNRELNGFVATVAHDLRSPLTPIVGYADFLRQKWQDHLDVEAHELLAKISGLGREMSDTMEDLLVLARVGRLEPPDEPVAVGRMVDGVIEAEAGRISAARLSVETGDLPDVCLPESLLRQVFANLVGNAVRYGAEGGRIGIGGEREGDVVRFHVRDHGPGIPEAERGHIFDLFYRGSIGKPKQGTGVGLAIVQKIARHYHGRVWVEETAGGGATFWVEMVGSCAGSADPSD